MPKLTKEEILFYLLAAVLCVIFLAHTVNEASNPTFYMVHGVEL